MISRRLENSYLGNVDWLVVAIYLVLIFCGWFNIYAAVYNEAHSSMFDLSQRYGMQLVWIGIAVFVAISILLIDEKYYHILAYPLYILSLLLMVSTLVLGTVVNGAKAWLIIGPVALQPVEFVKITTALALARFMSSYHFDIRRTSDVFKAGLIVGLPVLIAIMQNDTGSALVYSAFLVTLFREGFNIWVYVVLVMVVALFVFSFLLEPAALLVGLILVCLIFEGTANGRWRSKAIYLAGLALVTGGIYSLGLLPGVGGISIYASLLIAVVLSLAAVLVYAYRYKLRNVFVFILLFAGSLGFIYIKDYIFENVVQEHQQKRILDLLGIESDLHGWGYNVNQSKIAIGSGGFTGKGYMQGTQTKFNFVPEQSTDFIFCTMGEEWGFVGSSIIVLIFATLIYRLFRMGERQGEPFGRIYCYSAAGIFLFHMVINIGMTIGIMPVIGIPLPFFSYGGSSMLTFTMLLFIAVKLDASRSKIN